MSNLKAKHFRRGQKTHLFWLWATQKLWKKNIQICNICSLPQTWVKMFYGLMTLRFHVFGYHSKNLLCTKTTLYISRWKTIFTDHLLFLFCWNQNLCCAAFKKVDHSILFKGGPCNWNERDITRLLLIIFIRKIPVCLCSLFFLFIK